MKVIKRFFFEYWFSIFILLGVYVGITYPLFHDGFFPTLDDVQVVRIDEMTKELLSGQFPVRYVNDLGNGGGYMLFSFYPPLAYYLGTLVHFLGFSLVKATKLTFLFGYFIATTGMFLLLRHFFSKTLAVLGTMLFITSPFFNYEVYIRGALAEFLGFSFFPLTIYLFIKLIEKRTFLFFLLFGISYACLILSHTFVGLFGTVFLLAALLLFVKRKQESIQPLLGIVLGLSATCWFWLPVYFEQSFTKYSINYFAKQSFLTNFLSPLAIAGFNPPQWTFSPPLLGMVLTVAAVIGIVFGLLHKQVRRSPLFVISLLGLLFSLFFISEFSRVLWLHSSFLQYMQFPWRFLVFATVFAVILAVFFLSMFRHIWIQLVIGGLVLFLSYFLYSSYLHPKSYNFISQYFAEDSCGTTTWAQEYLPKWVEKCLPRSKNREFIYPKIIAEQGITIQSLQEFSHGRKVVLETSGGKGAITLRKYYFPGWNVVVDNSVQLSIYPNKPYGLLLFTVPEGKHTVVVSFDKTMIQKIAEIGSITLVVGTILVFLFLQKRIIKRKKI